jgi:hypothetical protein
LNPKARHSNGTQTKTIKKRLGSPYVSEIELSRLLTDEWPNVLNWLKKLDLLRSGELDRLVSPA